MILVLEIDDGSLFLYPSLAEAESHIEAIDRREWRVLFCDDTGRDSWVRLLYWSPHIQPWQLPPKTRWNT